MELLDRLARETGCEYISNLRLLRYWAQLSDVLNRTNASEYGMKEWDDAIQYIAVKNRDFDSREDAKAYLIDYITSSIQEDQRK